eukprot:TRINITY_DN2469_c0_g1_i6.p1 TRINITY_DN2469_c0_g1~~TRINITY_DN2469_c0_g1_i6.p1  ORF type:complete len:347 (+),score=109.93 TRINITY_DN2469_c0_g1_i6:170-1210(+)
MIGRRKSQPEAKPIHKSNGTSFLSKVYDILEEPSFAKIICWNENGTGFVVKKVNDFTDKVLPNYFKHKNFASFVRQLNMYGFHKMKGDNCFSHSLFCRGMKHLIKNIKRKTGSTEEGQVKKDATDKLLSTLNELNERLIKLESKEDDYEKLMKDYKEIKDRNKQLEQMLLCFSQSLSANARNHFADSIDGIEANGNFNGQNLYASPSIRNLLGDNAYQFGRISTSKLQTMGKFDGQCKMIAGPDKYMEEEKAGLPVKRPAQLEGDVELAPLSTSPKLADGSPIVLGGVTPVELSPLNPPSEEQMDCEPNYLKEIELSPPRYDLCNARKLSIDNYGNIIREDLVGDK